jgi:ferritin-like metal-binding protein YciE
MSLFSAEAKDLRALYVEGLHKALDSERQIVEKGLPSMIEAARNPELVEGLRAHLEESKMHVSRLERILDDDEGETNTAKCKATASLISEADSAASNAAEGAVRDVVLIASGNKVEHHEIAVYGTLRTWAELLGEPGHAAELEKTLKEEKAADETLTALSRKLNVQAPAFAGQ